MNNPLIILWKLFQELRPVGWVNIPVFDYKAMLHSGQNTLYLWPVENEDTLMEELVNPIGIIFFMFCCKWYLCCEKYCVISICSYLTMKLYFYVSFDFPEVLKMTFLTYYLKHLKCIHVRNTEHSVCCEILYCKFY